MSKPPPDVAWKKDECPQCLYEMDCATCVTGPTGTKPREGDLSLCVNCGATLVFDDRGYVRAITDDEERELPAPTRRVLDRGRFLIRRRPFLKNPLPKSRQNE